MLNSSKNHNIIQMLNEYEKILDELFEQYENKKITFETCISILSTFKDNWNYCRFDLKNFGNEKSKIEFINMDEELDLSYPQWLKNNSGEGYKIEYYKDINLKLQISNEDKLKESTFKIWLRGLDFRKIDNVKKPIYVNFTQFKINEDIIFNENKLLWHNQPFIFEKICKSGEFIDLDIKFKTIYDYFPQLNDFFNNIKSHDDLIENYKNFKNYIKYEKLIYELDFMHNNSLERYNSFNQYQNNLSGENNFINSYNEFFIQTNIIELANKIDNVRKKVESLENRYNNFEKNTAANEDGANFLLNTLYLDYHLEPNTLLNNLQILCNELLTFVDNICKKHDLNWWLDYGNLLGAVRHENFIPWDDDMDIGMMRKDYHKFIDVMYDEIKNHNLEDYIDVVYRYRNYRGTEVNSFIQLFVKDKPNGKMKKTDIMAGVDIFPYDFMVNFNPSTFGNSYNYCKTNFYKGLCNGEKTSEVYMGLDYNEALKTCFSELNLSYDKEKYIIPGVEGSCGYKGTNLYEVAILETETIFPLIDVKYGDYTFPAPNDPDYYLKQFYGNYLRIPKDIRTHGRVNNFRHIKNINKTFEKFIYIFKAANIDF